MTKTWTVKAIAEVEDLVFFSNVVEQTVQAVLKKERFDYNHKSIPNNIAPISKRDKIDAIKNHRSRFRV